VTEEDVKAKYLNGTLNLIVPKKEKQIPQKKNIEID
jgi:HSP20 family molecular chaperone IbpA